MDVFLGGWFDVLHVYGSDFLLLVYDIYTTPYIYVLKNLNRTLFFKKKHIFILLLASFHLQNRASRFLRTTLRISRNRIVIHSDEVASLESWDLI